MKFIKRKAKGTIGNIHQESEQNKQWSYTLVKIITKRNLSHTNMEVSFLPNNPANNPTEEPLNQ